MAEHAKQDDLMQSLTGKLYTVLTGHDETVQAADERFVTWCTPGLPITKEDLSFAKHGITGATGAEAKNFLQRSADFSRIVNFVPEPLGIYQQSGTFIWDIYGRAFAASEVASSELDEKTKEKLEKFRGLLEETKMVQNIVTDVEEPKIEGGPMLKAYKAKQADWESALLEYNNKRISAMNADDARVVQDFALNGDLYRKKVQSAMDAWVANGYKNEVDQINAFIAQVTQRDLSLWKAALQNRFNGAKLTPLDNLDFYYTAFAPTGFAESESGWTEFSFTESNYEKYEKSTINAWSAEGGAQFLGFGAKLKAAGSSESKDTTLDTSDFKMSFQLAQMPIVRPWFAPEFLNSKAWRVKPGTGESLVISDGEEPPKGDLVAYPTTLVLARDIVIDFKELHNKESLTAKTIEGGGSVSYGLFSLGGSYKHGDREHKVSSHMTGQGLKVDGMQIIGFKCALLPKSPNPSTEIESWT